MTEHKKNIVIIGAGNLAYHLAPALKKCGHSICQIYSRTEVSAKALSQLLNTAYTNDIKAIKNDADIYIFALKDAILPDFLNSFQVKDGLFVHCAGSVPLTIFKSHASNYGVLYPMQTFSKQKDIDFSKIPVFVEASDQHQLNILTALARELSPDVYELNSEKRKLLHIAAVFSCNFSNHMYAIAEDLMQSASLDFKLLLPLINETAEKLGSLSPRQAQTGPAIRYDESIINDHRSALNKMPEAKELYEKISQNIHRKNKNKDV